MCAGNKVFQQLSEEDQYFQTFGDDDTEYLDGRKPRPVSPSESKNKLYAMSTVDMEEAKRKRHKRIKKKEQVIPLRHLDLNGCDLTANGAISILKVVAHLRHMKFLDLSDNNLGPQTKVRISY